MIWFSGSCSLQTVRDVGVLSSLPLGCFCLVLVVFVCERLLSSCVLLVGNFEPVSDVAACCCFVMFFREEDDVRSS